MNRPSMDESRRQSLEEQLDSLARGMEYPPTPDVARSVMSRLRAPARPRRIARGFAWSLAALLVFLASLMLIPPARAALAEFIQIGIVRIFRSEPAATAPPPQSIPATMTPVPPPLTSTPLIPLLEQLAGEMTLEQARQRVRYAIAVPAYPPDLGRPDRVFVQDAGSDVTILVWVDPARPDEVRMSLHIVPPGSWSVDKMDPTVVQETRVSGERAVWAVGPYPVRFSNGRLDFVRMIDGHVLIWTDGPLTYRLETRLDLEEAIRVAESMEAEP